MYGAQTEAADPYSFRLEPVYRKLRYEISCAIKGLRGTDDWRKGEPNVPGGLYKLWPKAADGTPLTPVTPAIQADKDYLERAGKALKALADKLKVKPEELTTDDFTREKLEAPAPRDKPDQEGPLLTMTKVVEEVIVKAKAKGAKDPAVKDPLAEPDPAEEAPVKAGKPKVADPAESEPAASEPAAAAPAKPAKAKAAPEPGE